MQTETIMKPDYTVTRLSPGLIYIIWHRTPVTATGDAFLEELKTLLDSSSETLFFLSDLRRGRIIDIGTISRLSDLSRHPNWGGSSAFSANPISRIFVNSFLKYAREPEERNSMFNDPADAIRFLEALHPGITADIDWETVLKS